MSGVFSKGCSFGFGYKKGEGGFNRKERQERKTKGALGAILILFSTAMTQHEWRELKQLKAHGSEEMNGRVERGERVD
jgi:hypothetical protein